MPGKHDYIFVSKDCPRCGRRVTVPWGVVRVTKAMGCDCGIFIDARDVEHPGLVREIVDAAMSAERAND